MRSPYTRCAADLVDGVIIGGMSKKSTEHASYKPILNIPVTWKIRIAMGMGQLLPTSNEGLESGNSVCNKEIYFRLRKALEMRLPRTRLFSESPQPHTACALYHE